jgi:hypothetical protein
MEKTCLHVTFLSIFSKVIILNLPCRSCRYIEIHTCLWTSPKWCQNLLICILLHYKLLPGLVSLFGDLSVENVSELNRIHIRAQCRVNWSAGLSYPHSRACLLIGSFCWGLLIVTTDRNIIFICSLIGFFFLFLEFHNVTTGNVLFIYILIREVCFTVVLL